MAMQMHHVGLGIPPRPGSPQKPGRARGLRWGRLLWMVAIGALYVLYLAHSRGMIYQGSTGRRFGSEHDAYDSDGMDIRASRKGERRYDGLRVYVYNLPRKFNEEMVETVVVGEVDDPDLLCPTNQYRLEHTFHRQLMKQRDVVTKDPNKAHIFYVPIYSACHEMLSDPHTNQTALYIHAALRHVRKLPYWDRSAGTDHLWVFTHGQGAGLMPNWAPISPSTFIVQNGQLTFGQYRHGKDIVAPPDLSGLGWDPIFLNQTVAGTARKKWLAVFHAQSNATLTNVNRDGNIYSRGVSQYLETAFKSHQAVQVVPCDSDAVEEMAQATFCLASEGWYATTQAPYKAILRGCIPIILSDQVALAFEDRLDWSRFAIFVHPDDVVHIDKIIDRITITEVRSKQAMLQEVWRYFWYGHGGRAMDTILQTLADRRPPVRYSRHYRMVQH